MPASRSLLALGFSLLLTDAAAAEAFRFQGRVDVIPAKVVDATEKALASPTCTGQEDGARTASVPASGGVTVTVAPVDEASGNPQLARKLEADPATTVQEDFRSPSCMISVVYE